MMGNGVLNPNYVDDCNSPRPAPTLNPSSILFSSQAVGGKATEVGKLFLRTQQVVMNGN